VPADEVETFRFPLLPALSPIDHKKDRGRDDAGPPVKIGSAVATDRGQRRKDRLKVADIATTFWQTGKHRGETGWLLN